MYGVTFHLSFFNLSHGHKTNLRIYLHRVYMCSCDIEILAHAERFGLFHLFTLFLEGFHYTARVRHALHTTGCILVAASLVVSSAFMRMALILRLLE